MYQHIVCAIDLEVGTEVILETGTRLARLSDARLTLVTVVDPSLMVLRGGVGSLSGPDDQVEGLEHAEEDLLALARRHLEALAARHHPGAEVLILEGPPVYERVLEAVIRVGADLLVVGSHGNRTLRRLLLGSVCHKLVQKAPVPVLVIKPVGAAAARRATGR